MGDTNGTGTTIVAGSGDPPQTAGGMRSYTSPVPNVFPPPESLRPTLIGERYMVVTGHPLVSRIAADVLDRGGTAIDAGVAAGLASNVIQADMCNLGGVSPILLRQAGSRQVWSISGVGTWSREVTLDRYLERYKADMPLGAPCSIVPAALDSWVTALSRFGTWPFSAIAEAAAQYAEEGFLLDRRTALAYELMGGAFKSWPSSASIYWPASRPPIEGERLRQPDLACMLRRLIDAEKGGSRSERLEAVRRAFYEGEVADRIVAWVNEGGGWMSHEDLSEFRNEVVPAKTYAYAGWELATGDVYCQGPVILQALSILAGFDIAGMPHNGPEYLHHLVEALKIAFSERERCYGDPRFTGTRLEDLLADDHVRRLRSLVQPRTALPDLVTLGADRSTGAKRTLKRRDTTNLVVLDAAGNAFSAAASDTIDGNPIVPGLGIMVSPRGVQSRLDPTHPACLAPGKRPRLTPAPLLALHKFGSDEEARPMAISASGGDVIPQGILQVLLNVVHFGMSPQQAVEAARITTLSFPDSFFPHVHDKGRLSVEARIGEATRAELSGRGHRVHLWPDYEFDSSGTSIALDLAPPGMPRVLAGGADPRRSSYTIAR